MTQLNPGRIMETATAFWGSKVLLTAIEFDLFSALAKEPRNAQDLGEALGIHPRGRLDFFDALVSLGFLERDGDGPAGIYRNTAETALFLDKNKPSYIGGMPEMLNSRLFGFWNDLGDALRTGQPQNEVKRSRKPIFEELYANAENLEEFLGAMTGLQAASFQVLADAFPFADYKTACDAGGASALCSRVLAKKHPHMTFHSFDLPPVTPIATKLIRAEGLEDRIQAVSGDFFEDDLPKADLVLMGNVLHDWNLEKKKALIAKAYAALPTGGALIAVENIIDDARRQNTFGLLMSLNMLIEFGEEGFDYTGADFREWCTEAGFKRFEMIPLAGPTSAAVAFK